MTDDTGVKSDGKRRGWIVSIVIVLLIVLVFAGFLTFAESTAGKLMIAGGLVAFFLLVILAMGLGTLTTRLWRGRSLAMEEWDTDFTAQFIGGIYCLAISALIGAVIALWPQRWTAPDLGATAGVVAFGLGLFSLQFIFGAPVLAALKLLVVKPLDQIGLAKPLGALAIVVFIIYGIVQIVLGL